MSWAQVSLWTSVWDQVSVTKYHWHSLLLCCQSQLYYGRTTHVFALCTNVLVMSYSTGNTVSNLIMIIPPICGAIQTFRDGLEFRYICSFIGLTGAFCNLWNNIAVCIHTNIGQLLSIYHCVCFGVQLLALAPGASTWRCFMRCRWAVDSQI